MHIFCIILDDLLTVRLWNGDKIKWRNVTTKKWGKLETMLQCLRAVACLMLPAVLDPEHC